MAKKSIHKLSEVMYKSKRATPQIEDAQSLIGKKIYGRTTLWRPQAAKESEHFCVRFFGSEG